VTIENIHQHLEMGKNKKLAILDACNEISFPKLLILLCILAVFAPSLIMTGVPKAMFLPLSLAIAFAMICSYTSAQTLVPAISNWILKAELFQKHPPGAHEEAGFFGRLKNGLVARLSSWMPRRRLIVSAYLVLSLGAAITCFLIIGKDLLPRTNNGQLQLRLKEPDGTRLEVTERMTRSVLQLIDTTVQGHVDISSAFVGLVPSSFGTSNLYIFNSGTHESVVQINLDERYKGRIDELKEELRRRILNRFPQLHISFEPIELTEKIMAQGASTPIEVRVAGKNMEEIKDYARRLTASLQHVSYLRDVQIAQPLNLPTIQISIDRNKLALMGLSIDAVSRSITDATSSSRYTDKNLWLDDKVAYTYQTQVQVPEHLMNSVQQLQSVSLVKGQARPLLSDVATIDIDTLTGEYDRAGPRRYVTVSANLYKKDLGSATEAVEKAIHELGPTSTGLIVEVKGMSSLLRETLDSLQTGLLAAIVVILLLLAANYQSFGVAISVLATVPAVLLGSMLLLLATGATLNLQSYMGIIMSTGVSVANALLIVTNAEKLRLKLKDPFKAAITSASIRLRPIMMTSIAMIVGMIPMASGLGEAGDQSAPLGRAVIGGLAASTFAALLVVPLVYGWIQQKRSFTSASLLPEDEA